MSKLLEYLNYLWRSTNQHGVHSPFVFDLVTQALYADKSYGLHPAISRIQNISQLPKKYLRPLNRALYHLLGPEDPGVIDLRKSPLAQGSENALIYLDLSVPANTPLPEQLPNLMNEQQVLLVIKRGTPDVWKSLIAEKDLHLSIDCFHFGLVFRRPQQAKEHFTIRL